MVDNYDFSGWATRNNLRCSDGRTILKDAFKGNDGQIVPLVWNHQHNDPLNVLGHALLENREEGVYAYGVFNDTPAGQSAKELVLHGDISALSIYANKLKQQGPNVLHGVIRELSLVLAGANPGAFIDSVMSHGEDADEEAIIYTGENIVLFHSAEEDEIDEEEIEDESGVDEEEGEPELEHADETAEKEEEPVAENKTVKEVFDGAMEKLSDVEQDVVYAVIGAVAEDAENNDSEGGEEEMKHNVFDSHDEGSNVLSHAEQMDIIKMAKSSQVGTFQTALEIYAEENDLQHDAVSGGFVQTGEGNVSLLFPEYAEVRPGAPELITNDQGWIGVVMNKVHKSPISRIRTSQVDIRNIDALRAQGYKKGKQKGLTGNFKLVRRTTDPQTVYVKNALHRDDIVDITDFDYVQYLYNIDKMMLNEELATAIMLGDGREDGDEGKIESEHIRPIWTDDDLYTIHVDLDIEAARAELQGTDTAAHFGENYVRAEATVNTVLYAREQYKGSGTPDYFCTPHALNVMLLARDQNGRRIYATKSELAAALNVGNIYTAEQFEGKVRTTDDNKKKKLVGIIANLNDYSLGATKGGEVTHFTQFDIDFNQEKSLLETRCSGALTRVYSAIAIEEDVTAQG